MHFSLKKTDIFNEFLSGERLVAADLGADGGIGAH